ncbi:hypothetical protein FBALC1_07698 [Flavobacteriales bacterium ALC-1]|nr:hypothetical protein FBALC1_07698 [Flavobacteriales bacterium ALC-1]
MWSSVYSKFAIKFLTAIPLLSVKLNLLIRELTSGPLIKKFVVFAFKSLNSNTFGFSRFSSINLKIPSSIDTSLDENRNLLGPTLGLSSSNLSTNISRLVSSSPLYVLRLNTKS